MVFIIPFIIFLLRKSLSRKLIRHSLVLFALGATQGFLGWFMVKSGLIDKPSVSHYRLALHLSAAFLTFCYILWVILSILRPSRQSFTSKRTAILARLLTAFISIQIIYGAFVAGLKAGLVYPTWPKMGADWIPNTVIQDLQHHGFTSLFSQMVSVQFVHRTMAYLVVLLVGLLWFAMRNENLNSLQQKSIGILFLTVTVQFALGVFTLLHLVPVFVRCTSPIRCIGSAFSQYCTGIRSSYQTVTFH